MALFCCCACRSVLPGGSEPPATNDADDREARAGELIRTEHYLLRASPPEDCAESDPALRSAPGHRIGLELSLEPTGDVQVPANPYYARLVDAEHNVYEATLGGCGAPLTPTLPTRGQPARGWVVFELSRAVRPVTFLYAPELVGAQKTELTVELRR
jgi:hypothetical protein